MTPRMILPIALSTTKLNSLLEMVSIPLARSHPRLEILRTNGVTDFQHLATQTRNGSHIQVAYGLPSRFLLLEPINIGLVSDVAI